jgi:hypothetical protein
MEEHEFEFLRFWLPLGIVAFAAAGAGLGTTLYWLYGRRSAISVWALVGSSFIWREVSASTSNPISDLWFTTLLLAFLLALIGKRPTFSARGARKRARQIAHPDLDAFNGVWIPSPVQPRGGSGPMLCRTP